MLCESRALNVWHCQRCAEELDRVRALVVRADHAVALFYRQDPFAWGGPGGDATGRPEQVSGAAARASGGPQWDGHYRRPPEGLQGPRVALAKATERSQGCECDNDRRSLRGKRAGHWLAAGPGPDEGYRETHVDGVLEAAVKAVLGPMLAMARAVAELAASVFDWVYDYISAKFTKY